MGLPCPVIAVETRLEDAKTLNIAKYSVSEASYFVFGEIRLISASFAGQNKNKGAIVILKNAVNVYIFGLAIIY